jgi:phytoene desaturase
MPQQNPKVIVIGAGLGGLAAAAYLLNRGLSVEVHEKNSSVGGKIQEFNKDGFRFDTGPSLLTMPAIFAELYKEMGLNFYNEFNLFKLNPICRYFFNSGTVVNSYHEVNAFKEELKQLDSADAENLEAFLNYSEEIYQIAAPLFLYTDFHRKLNLADKEVWKSIFNLHKIDPLKPMSKAVGNYFKSDEVKQLFLRYATYSGSSPYTAPATLNIIPHVEYKLGSFYPLGGIRRVIDRLTAELLKKGVKFFFASEVKRLLINGNRAYGIVNQNGLESLASAVICNSDVKWSYENLLASTKFNKLEPSTSGAVFLWGINRIHKDLSQHNIFFSADYKKEFSDLTKNLKYPLDPTVYVNITSKAPNSSDAPLGQENWFVLVNLPYLVEEQDVEAGIKDVKLAILKRLNKAGLKDLENHILFEKTISPEDFSSNYYSNRGSIYGISSNSKSSAFLRQSSFSRSIKGFFFCGGSVHPGGGMPLVILSGKNAALAAFDYLK